MRRRLALTLLTGVMLTPISAMAQFEGAESGGVTAVLSTAASTGLSTSAGFIALLFSPSMLTTSVGQGVSKEQSAALMLYLRANPNGLREAVTMGGGTVFEDFANALEMRGEGRASLARALRASRHELLELADPEALDIERARAFSGALTRALNAHAQTRRALELTLEPLGT